MQLAARPESESLASKPLSTLWLYQPAPFGSVVGPESLITGAVVSTLTVAEAVSALVVLAASVQLGAPARPEPASLAVTVSVTEAVLFQPAVLAVWETVIVGFVWSRVIESIAVVERLPAASLYWTQTVFEPSPAGSVWLGLAM